MTANARERSRKNHELRVYVVPLGAYQKLRAAAEKGDIQAQLRLGLKHRDGVGVREDTQEAMRWLRLAAEQGSAEAQHAFGELLCYASSSGGKVAAEEKSGVPFAFVVKQEKPSPGRTRAGPIVIDLCDDISLEVDKPASVTGSLTVLAGIEKKHCGTSAWLPHKATEMRWQP